MMKKELLQVFNLLLQFKDVKKDIKYIIDTEDMFIIYNYWKIYGLNNYITLKKFRKCVVEYSVFTGKTLHNACDEFSKKIKIE